MIASINLFTVHVPISTQCISICVILPNCPQIQILIQSLFLYVQSAVSWLNNVNPGICCLNPSKATCLQIESTSLLQTSAIFIGIENRVLHAANHRRVPMIQWHKQYIIPPKRQDSMSRFAQTTIFFPHNFQVSHVCVFGLLLCICRYFHGI